MSQQDEDMRCEIALDHIEAFIDDELPTEFALGLRRHLKGCPSCARELKDARRTIAAVRAMPEFDPPQRTIEAVRLEVEAQGRGRSAFHGRRTRLLAVAAAVLISVLGGTAVMRHDRGPDAEALRAAAEIEYALACVGEITRRANRTATARVMNGTAVSSAVDGVTRTLDRSSSLLPTVVPPTDSQPSEGSS